VCARARTVARDERARHVAGDLKLPVFRSDRVSTSSSAAAVSRWRCASCGQPKSDCTQCDMCDESYWCVVCHDVALEHARAQRRLCARHVAVQCSAYASRVNGAVVGGARVDVLASITVARRSHAWQGNEGRVCATVPTVRGAGVVGRCTTEDDVVAAPLPFASTGESSSDARAALAGQPEATLLTAPPSPSASRRRCACESCTTVR
jgi:hypothetical protein